jgi:amino acid transporter
VYLRRGFGTRTAFLYGWMSLLVTDPGLTALMASGLARYAGSIVPLSAVGAKFVAVGAIFSLVGEPAADYSARAVSCAPSWPRASPVQSRRKSGWWINDRPVVASGVLTAPASVH